jgi:hypothetical protein
MLKALFSALLILQSNFSYADRTIYILPPPGFETDAQFFNPHARDDCHKVFCELKQRCDSLGYDMTLYQGNFLNSDDYLLVFDMYPSYVTVLNKLSSDQLFLIIFEPPTVNPWSYNFSYHALFNKVFTMNDMFIDNNKYHKFYYPQPDLTFYQSAIPFNEKKLCTLIAGNKQSTFPLELYSHRFEIINFFNENYPLEFDLYGPNWPINLKVYRGMINTKRDILQHYKFCICYENTKNLDGYITEKIFDCFVSGCVPIYLGASNISQYIPYSCFIDRRKFTTNQELHNFLNSVTEAQYEEYLRNIKNFLSSEKAYLFSIDNFVNTLLTHILHLKGTL